MSLLPMHKRLEWIEVAKGIGILSVITVHSIIPQINAVTTHLSSFTIPLFFILGGLTYNNDRHRKNLWNFIKTRARRLLIPYFSLYIIMIVLFIPLGGLVDTYLTLDQLVFWFIYGAGPPDASTHLWFLPVFYFGIVLFASFDTLMDSLPYKMRLLLIPFFAALGSMLNDSFSPVLVPWRLGAVLVAGSFVAIGNTIRQVKRMKPWTSNSLKIDLSLIIVGVTILWMLSETNGFTDIAVDNLGNSVWLYLLTGTIGASLVFLVANIIEKRTLTLSGAIIKMGAKSQEIYELHPIAFYFVPLVLFILGYGPTEISLLHPVLWPLRLMFGLSFSASIALYLMKHSRLLQMILSGRVEQVWND